MKLLFTLLTFSVIASASARTLECEGSLNGPGQLGDFTFKASVADDMVKPVTRKLGNLKIKISGLGDGVMIKATDGESIFEASGEQYATLRFDHKGSRSFVVCSYSEE